jgi:predicted Zn-ribbon and HTH transcriptional regulator
MAVKRKIIKHTKHKKELDGQGRIKTKIYHKPALLLPEYRCKFCGHKSIPRVNEPKVCPHCHRSEWIAGK